MLRSVMDTLRSLLELLLRAVLGSPWRLDEIADLPDDVDATVLTQGAGLSSDGSTAWAERTRHAGALAIIVRRVTGRPIERLPMFQRDGKQVDLRLGNMNDAHVVAGTANSSDASHSSWAIVDHADASATWLEPTAPGVRCSASGINNAGLIVGNSPTACSWATETAAFVEYPRGPVQSLAAAGVAPNTSSVAGAFVQTDGDGRPRPWFQTANGQSRLGYVDGLRDGAAHDVNDSDTSCGEGTDADTSARVAWRWWRSGSTTNRLTGLAGAGSADSVARSVNRYNEAVGRSDERAVFWPNWSRRGATPALDLTAQLGDPNLVLSDALRINDNVDILCFGWRRRADDTRAYKMFLVRNTGPKLRLFG
jgi:hypothetical protein